MKSKKMNIYKNNLSYNKKKFLIETFFNYKTLLGNKKVFTNSESYEYIFGFNSTGNTIFNFNKSLFLLKKALSFIKQVKKNKGTILFVGTRHDLRKIVKEIAKKSELPYVNYRWSKGLLTNWENTNTSIKFYNLFFKTLDIKTKKRKKIENTFFGLTSMTHLPEAIFIFDVNTDLEAFKEAKTLNIPVISLVDTNVPIRKIDYPILANTQSILSIIFFGNLIIKSLR
jgi:small subunit ribosomal protein S2